MPAPIVDLALGTILALSFDRLLDLKLKRGQ